MSEQESEKEQADPFANLINFYDQWAKNWAGVMSEAVASPQFVKTMADQMEEGLEFYSLLRRQSGEAMEHYLSGLNLPTQKEVNNISERLTHIEMRLDDMEDKLDQCLDRLANLQDS